MRRKTSFRRAIIHFSRWNRKGWSAFASMHREIKICVLCVSMSMISSATLTGADKKDGAEVDSTRNHILENAQVTSTRAVRTRSIVPQTTLYQRSRNEAAALQSYEAALRLLPAVDVRERGGLSSQADLTLRGGSADQTMVMLNGINFTDARTGHQSHSLPVDIESVASISLSEGVSGAGALSGAINVCTNALYPTYLRAELSAGMYGYLYGSASGAYSTKAADYFAALSFRNSDGYRYNTDLRNYNAYFRATAGDARVGTFDFQAGMQNRRFGSNGFYAAYNPDQYEQTSTYLASLKWNYALNDLDLSASVSYRKNYDRYEWIKGTPTNWHNTDNVGAEVFAQYSWIAGSTSFGADLMYNHIFSSNLGETMDSPKGKDGRYKKAGSRTSTNIYLRHQKSWKVLDISAMGGASFTPYGTAALWSAALTVRPVQGLNVKVSANQSMRLPTFTDLYYISAAQVNNLDLVPEKAITCNLGINYSISNWHFSLGGYFRDIRDRIAWVWRDNLEVDGKEYTSVWHSEQQTRMYTYGTEAMVSYRSDRGFLRNITASYGFIDSDEKSKILTSTVLDYMRHKTSLSAEMVFLKRFSLGVSASVYDRYGTYLKYEFDDEGNPVKDENGVMLTSRVDFNPYFLLDLRLSYAFALRKTASEDAGCRLYVDVKNATNTSYCDFGGIMMPGIWATAGIVITLPSK